MEAQKKRNINLNSSYDQFIQRADKKTHIIKQDAGIPDTVKLMKSVIQENIPQARAVAQELKGKDLYNTCQNVWNFFYDNVQYTKDEKGKDGDKEGADEQYKALCKRLSSFVTNRQP